MKTYTGKVKIEGKEVGTYSFSGPADAKELATTPGTVAVEFALVTGVKGTDTFESFDAWLYGAKLKASAPVRIAAEAGVVKDHKITMSTGQVTDLDALPFDKACKLVTNIRESIAFGLAVNPKNTAKVEHFAKVAVESGKATDSAGALVPAKNGAAKK